MEDRHAASEQGQTPARAVVTLDIRDAHPLGASTVISVTFQPVTKGV
ncbi:hypothetical protein [Frondihabitans sp. VKM Ac-2883]|nr:hypothetical protein [Frondihabitans sp. VKM Ac-2883]MBF4575067.1 hypothetical protein [Frondihabitans sp. VKM Ac-2883]